MHVLRYEFEKFELSRMYSTMMMMFFGLFQKLLLYTLMIVITNTME